VYVCISMYVYKIDTCADGIALCMYVCLQTNACGDECDHVGMHCSNGLGSSIHRTRDSALFRCRMYFVQM
jgi:hypothetical protein